MKKIVISALMFYATLVSWNLFAQSSVIAHRFDLDYQIESTIIKEYRYPSTITCFNTEDRKVVFVLGLSNHQTIEVETSGFYVTDMDIDVANDTVYFCGYDLEEQSHGIFGFFDINSVFYSSGDIYVHDYFVVGDENIYAKKFKKLLYYRKSDNTPYIACIGETAFDNYPCIVDIYPNSMGTYTGGHVKNDKETFTDIKFASCYANLEFYDFLVTVGTESTNGTYISIRYYDKDNVISAPGDQDYLNTFSVNMSDMREWLLSDVLVTSVWENIISTVSYRRSTDNPIFQDPDNIHVAFYDFRDLAINHSLFSMTKSVEIPGVVYSMFNPSLHRYISQGSSFKTVFLQTLSVNGGNPSSFCEINYPTLSTSGSVNLFGDRDIRLQGLSSYNGTSNYIMSGYSISNTSKLIYEMETFGNLSTCVDAKEHKYIDKEPMASIRKYDPIFVTGGVYSAEPVTKKKKEVPIFIDCPRTDEQE